MHTYVPLPTTRHGGVSVSWMVSIRKHLGTPIHWIVLVTVLAALPQTVMGQNGDQRLIIRGLSFSGNRAIDDLTLRVSIATSQSSWVARFPLTRWIGFLGSKRFFDETEFRRDVLRVRTLYRRSGFREVEVDTLVRRTDKNVNVEFLITEGEPVRVISLTVTGVHEILDQQKLVRELPLQVGEPFDLALMQATVDSIRGRLLSLGYPFPDVLTNFNARIPDRTATVSFDAYPGPRARIGRIQVVGTEKIKSSFVRRTMLVQPGQLFNARELSRSQVALYRSNLFNFVNVGLADTAGVGEDSTVDVRVRVSEAALRRIRAGGGFGTIDCFRTQAGWTIYNFVGGGRTLELFGRLSKIGAAGGLDAGLRDNLCQTLAEDPRLTLNYNVTASLTEPYFVTRHTSASIRFTAEQINEFQAYLRKAIGGEVSVTWRTPISVPLTLAYGLSRTKTESDPANFCAFLNVCLVEDQELIFGDFKRRATLTFRALWDRTDSPLNPTRGLRINGELRTASKFIGSDELIQFVRGFGEIASHHPVGRRSVFAWRVAVGAVRAPEVIIDDIPNRFVPPEDRFYGGGPGTVRGFSQNELGPLVRVLEEVRVTNDTNDMGEAVLDSIIRPSATGGDRVLFANAEYRFFLPGFSGRAMGAIFVDAGQVWKHGTDEIPGIVVTPGIGVRFLSPLGPIRLDLGYNPTQIQVSPLFEVIEESELVLVTQEYPAPDDRDRGFFGSLRLHFSIGQAF